MEKTIQKLEKVFEHPFKSCVAFLIPPINLDYRVFEETTVTKAGETLGLDESSIEGEEVMPGQLGCEGRGSRISPDRQPGACHSKRFGSGF